MSKNVTIRITNEAAGLPMGLEITGAIVLQGSDGKGFAGFYAEINGTAYFFPKGIAKRSKLREFDDVARSSEDLS